MPASSSSQPGIFRRLLRLIWRVLLLFCAAIFVAILAALGRAGVECRAFSNTPPSQPTSRTGGDITAGLKGYARPEDQTLEQ